MTLLREIQAAALDSSVDLSDLLRKCKVLAARLKHAEFSEWVSHELNGYPNTDALPAYRKIKVNSVGHFSGPFGSGIRNAPIPASSIDEQLRHFVNEHPFFESIGTLSPLAKDSSAILQGHWPPDLVKYIQLHCPIYENQSLLDAWRVVPAVAISGVLDTVRTRILDFVLALEETEPFAGDVAPGENPKIQPQAVTTIFNTTINGGTVGAVGNVRAREIQISQAIPAKHHKQVEKLVKELREKLDEAQPADRAEAEQALVRVEQQLAAHEPLFPKIKSYLEIYAALVTVAAPTVEALQAILERLLR